MRLHEVQPATISPKAFAKESRISIATLYQCDDLMSIIVQMNPAVARRPACQAHLEEIARLTLERDTAKTEVQHYREEAHPAAGSEKGATGNPARTQNSLDLQEDNQTIP